MVFIPYCYFNSDGNEGIFPGQNFWGNQLLSAIDPKTVLRRYWESGTPEKIIIQGNNGTLHKHKIKDGIWEYVITKKNE